MASLSPESFARLPAEILIHGLGVTSGASHSHFIKLVRALAESAEDLGFRLFAEYLHCVWTWCLKPVLRWGSIRLY